MFQVLCFEMGDFQRKYFFLGNSQELTLLPIPCQAFSLGFLSFVLLLHLLASIRYCFSSVVLYLSARSRIQLGSVLEHTSGIQKPSGCGPGHLPLGGPA